MGPDRSGWILVGPEGSLWVLMVPDGYEGSLWFMMDTLVNGGSRFPMIVSDGSRRVLLGH